MKKGIIILLSALLVLSLLSASVSAWKISSIRYDEKINKNYETIDFYVSVMNPNSFKEKVTTSATILETGDYASQKKDLARKSSGIFLLSIDNKLKKGEYMVKITSKTKDKHSTRYRFIDVE